MTIQDLLQVTIDKKASDLHLVSGYKPTLRIDGQLVEVPNATVLSSDQVAALLLPLLTDDQSKMLATNKELDFSYSFGPGRLRINAYYQKGSMAVAFRLIPLRIRSIDELGLPPICRSFVNLKQGFILVTGPTGHGKSTTIAAIVDEINKQIGGHILTIEDPIEYLYSKEGKALVSQRELGLDTHSWSNALRAALREDPNVVLVGEMRDYETIAAAITIAETGHLVFATLHTNSASESIDRIVDVFPENQQAQVKMMLSNSLEAIISQRLVPAISGGRVVSTEVLVATPAVRATIREGKTHLISNIIQTSVELGMMTMDMSLANLAKTGRISREVAMEYAASVEDVGRLLAKA